MWPFKKKPVEIKPEPVVLTFEMKGEMADKFAVLYDTWRNRPGSSYTEARAMWSFIKSSLPKEHMVFPSCTHEIKWNHTTPSIVTTETLEE